MRFSIQRLSQLLFLALTLSAGAVTHGAESELPSKPNFVIVFCDDLGYGDVGCFGSQTIKTPNIDRMAREGLKLTSFYAQTVCGPSRGALMTGCYPMRFATEKNSVEVHPRLHTNEITIAEVLKPVGYRSMAIGKWDLAGHSQSNYSQNLLPLHQGFDAYFGTPSSNDSIAHLIRGNDVIEKKVDMSLLTRRYTDEAVAFIKQNKEQPFFVYLAHTMPHVALAVSDQFRGKSAAGIYGDVVEEIDWNVGRILQTIEDEGLDENTYVIFTSDNGPWYLGRSPTHLKRIGPDAASHGGTAGPLRGAKTSTWDGGLRVPFVIRAPGRVPAGTQSDTVTATIDLLPTLAKLAGGTVPTDRVIDGRDLSSLFQTTHDMQIEKKPYFYYGLRRLEAVRMGNWKLHLPLPVNQKWERFWKADDRMTFQKPALFNLDNDIAESTDVAAKYPEVVAELMRHIEHARADIGDYDCIGKNARFFDPQPRRPDLRKKNR